MKKASLLILGFLLVLLILAQGGSANTLAALDEQVDMETGSSTDFDCGDVTEIPLEECEALVAFYNSTNGDGWVFNWGWLNTDTPCSWTGVWCNSNHVSILSLSENHLTGSIPSELGNLSTLGGLYLSHNQLSGSIPPELGNLSNLEGLELNDNQLSGSIPPELGNLSNLYHLDLYNNPMSGALPISLMNLDNLASFYFHNTGLCELDHPNFQAWLASIPYLQRTGIICRNIEGWVWVDDGDCVKEASETSGVYGIPVNLYLDGELHKTTNTVPGSHGGFYYFANLVPDTTYKVELDLPPDWTLLCPASGQHTIEYEGGRSINHNFAVVASTPAPTATSDPLATATPTPTATSTPTVTPTPTATLVLDTVEGWVWLDDGDCIKETLERI